MKTAELTGALLDYWTARADGVPAEQLEIREVPRTDWKICVRVGHPMPGRDMAMPYSTSWALGGTLVEKHRMFVGPEFDGWKAKPKNGVQQAGGYSPLIAICRAVVRAAFGDEVEDLPNA
jgi:hypothetical protein